MRRAHAITTSTIFTAALFAAAACGGKSSEDSGGGTGNLGGSAGSGNVSGSGGTGNRPATGGSGNIGGSAGVCEQGGYCATPGETCTPDECCACTYRCEYGSWNVAICPGCVAPACPPAPPQNGAACGPCEELIEPCVYTAPNCAPGSGNIRATCSAKVWQLEITPCPAPPPCGTDNAMPCAPGSLCVHPGGLGDYPYCAPNPCAPDQLVTCECAGTLCTSGYCVDANFENVICECPNC